MCHTGPMSTRHLSLPLLLAACTAAPEDSGSTEEALTCAALGSPYTQDDTLRLNHAQALGSHNSTHQQPEMLWDDSHAYTHPPLGEQLELGVRMLELDVHLREGVGYEVFHLPVLDEETSCLLLEDCLSEIKAWSDAHPCHLPVLVWIKPKDEADVLIEDLLPQVGRTAELEAALAAVWPAERVITPDEVRGTHDTLPAALSADGWPTLGALRGRILFSLIGGGEHRDTYLAESPDLADRWLFVDMPEVTNPAAAMAKDGSPEELRAWAEAGLLVTANVDGVTSSDEDNAARLAAALEAGVNFAATDFVVPQGDSSYVAEIPGGAPARCSPVTAPAGCTAADIETTPSR